MTTDQATTIVAAQAVKTTKQKLVEKMTTGAYRDAGFQAQEGLTYQHGDMICECTWYAHEWPSPTTVDIDEAVLDTYRHVATDSCLTDLDPDCEYDIDVQHPEDIQVLITPHAEQVACVTVRWTCRVSVDEITD